MEIENSVGNRMDAESNNHNSGSSISKPKKTGDTLAAKFGIAGPQFRRHIVNSPEQVKQGIWREFLKGAIGNLKVHNNFKNMRKYLPKNKLSNNLAPDLIPVNDNYHHIFRLIETAFDANIKNYIMLTGSSGKGRTSAVYYAINKIMERDYLRSKVPEDNILEPLPLTDVTNSMKYSSHESENNVSKLNYPKINSIVNGAPMPHQIERVIETKPLVFIEADAFIYNQEAKINNYVLNQLKSSCIENNLDYGAIIGQEESDTNSYAKLMKFSTVFRLVIYIKNIEVFAEETRQVYLYSFLDACSCTSAKLTLIVTTSCLFFMSKLEKRVKSRFSFKNFSFEDYKVEEELVPILEKRLEVTGAWPGMSEVVSEVKNAVKDEKITSMLHRYQTIGMSINWFVNLFKNAFLLMNHKELYESSKKDELAQYIFDKLLHSKKLLLFEGGDAQILKSLPRPARLIILVLHEVYSLRNQETCITYKKFRGKINGVINDKFSAVTTRNSWSSFSEMVIKENLLTLKKMKYIHLDKTPVIEETIIQLSDSVSPTFLTVKTSDSGISFE